VQGAGLGGVYTKTLHYLEQSVAHWVLAGRALPVLVPALAQDAEAEPGAVDMDDYARALDGLVLQGGNDVAPESYGERPLAPQWAGDPVRDRYETALVQAFVRAGKPVFGVCRGLQLLNVVFGGTLLQDIDSLRPGALPHRALERYERHYHAIEIEPGTRLAALYPGVRRALTNSIHHQCIRDLAPGFVVEARCPEDGTIEAVRRADGSSYVAAVQWHPEFHRRPSPAGEPETLDDSALLQDFLAAARAARGG
jgi:putative glutamine amidotransferase